MILVDTSVWIDYFRGRATPEAERLDILLAEETIVVGDIILTEILQGFDRDQDFDRALDALTSLDIIDLAGRDIAVKAAQSFRTLQPQRHYRSKDGGLYYFIFWAP